MSGKTLSFTLILLSLLAVCLKADTLAETFAQLERTVVSRQSEMENDIFQDFRQKYQCENCDAQTLEGLLSEFENYKRSWMKDMVNFIIKKMGVDDEKAQFVRANPEKYFVDYETFKLLRFA